MLVQMREIVSKMWKVAESLDKIQLGEHISFIKKDGNVRYAMKGETIILLFDIAGTNNLLNDKQIEYLRLLPHCHQTQRGPISRMAVRSSSTVLMLYSFLSMSIRYLFLSMTRLPQKLFRDDLQLADRPRALIKRWLSFSQNETDTTGIA